MYDEEESGGIMEKSLSKEKRDWSVVVKETATAMVCIKLVKRNVLVHFWPLLKAISTSFTSAFTNRSIDEEQVNDGLFDYGAIHFACKTKRGSQVGSRGGPTGQAKA